MKGIILLVLMSFLLHYKKNASVAGTDLQIFGVNFTNHSVNATENDNKPTSEPTTTEKLTKKMADNSFRSEVYKLHANSMLMLHAQRTRSGIGAKKSNLNSKQLNSGINYHIRKKTTNDTANTFTEIERHLEAKLGDLPQVRQKRYNQVSNNKTINSNHVVDILCDRSLYNLTNQVDCKHGNKSVTSQKRQYHHHHRHHHRRRKEHQWRSIVQGEDIYGEEVKKTKVYPEKFPDRREKISDRREKVSDKRSTITQNDTMKKHDIIPDSLLLLPRDEESKRIRLRRALAMMADGMDGIMLSRRHHSVRSSDKDILSILRDDTDRMNKKALVEPISVAPPVVPLRGSRTLINRKSEIPDDSDNNIPDLKSDYIEQIPKIREITEQDFIPRIPRIQPIGRVNDDGVINDVTDDKRDSMTLDRLLDVEEDTQESIGKIGPVEHFAPPTPIPDLTPISSISSIPDITEIPTLKSIPEHDGKEKSGSNVHVEGG